MNRTIILLAGCFLAATVLAQPSEYPLKPPDRSSPRAALKTFLDSGDAVGAFVAKDYLASSSHVKYEHLQSLAQTAMECLDLSELPPAARVSGGRSAAMYLYETLNRIALPPWDEIPDASQLTQSNGTNDVVRWVIPNTEILLERVPTGPHSGEFLFSPITVASAGDFYQKVRNLPCTRDVPLQNALAAMVNGGGWMIPYRWIQAMPSWLQGPLLGRPAWKWMALALLLGSLAWLFRLILRLSRWGSRQNPFLRALAQLALPAFVLVAVPVAAYLALVQISLTGEVGSTVQLVATAVMFLAGAWTVWRLAPVIAETIIASPHVLRTSIDANLIRISARLLGIVVAAGFLILGAERLGLPVYGIVAGLGVGGVAIALAAQPTIENLIGGLSLFADKPIRVGDFCHYGTDAGTVEAIGIRSTRIRGLDRTLTTIPNSVLSKLPVVNFTHRDQLLLKTTLGLRYETKPEQLRHVLAKLRELLLAHPMVTAEPSRVRFVGFGDFSLNLEVFAYIATKDYDQFLEVQEDLYLRMMDVVAGSGIGFAFPSQTVYFTRDEGMNEEQSAAAIAEVKQWRATRKLPFPDFDAEFRRTRRDTLDYPPDGSPAARPRPANQPGGDSDLPAGKTKPDQK